MNTIKSYLAAFFLGHRNDPKSVVVWVILFAVVMTIGHCQGAFDEAKPPDGPITAPD